MMLFSWHIHERPCWWTWKRLHEMTVPMHMTYLLMVSWN